jgi:hypothetical protein
VKVRVAWTLLALSFGSVPASIALVTAMRFAPPLTLEMDRDPGPVLTGVHGVERAGDLTFVWTRRTAALDLPDFDRSRLARCSATVRAGRGAPLAMPQVTLAVDGRVVAQQVVENDLVTMTGDVPVRVEPGLRLTLTTTEPFQPGPNDTRELGVQVDRLTCAPLEGRARAPDRALLAASLAAIILTAAAAMSGLGFAGIAIVALAAGALQAVPLSWQTGPYGPTPDHAVRLALAIGAGWLAIVWIGRRLGGRPWSPEALGVLAISAVAVHVKLLALLHPSKPVVDAVFQAHRLQWILEGRFYFTQPMPNGVEFPYAVALYVAAAPWTLLTTDFVSLLRVVVVVAEAASLALLYPLFARVWHDGRGGAIAVALGHLVPLPYVVVGNANLPNAFGQSVALAAFVAAVLLPAWRPARAAAVLFAAAAVAMLSHVSTLALAGAILAALAVAYRTTRDVDLRRASWIVFGATAAAALFAVVVYYGHFPDVYQRLDRLRPPAGGVTSTIGTRALDAGKLTITSIGWPIVVLAAAGLFSGLRRDRLTLGLAALGAAFAAFWLAGVLPSVQGPFERYVVEFIGRVVLATAPAAAILAARAVSRAQERPATLGAVAWSLVGMAGLVGLDAWLNWLR